jgi:hypothetical protein
MSNQLTTEEQIALIVGATQIGKKAKVRRNLMYVKTALGGTFIPVEVEEEVCSECGFYTSDPDSEPLENCGTCGRERV